MRKIVTDIAYLVNQRAFLSLLGFKMGKTTVSEELYSKMNRTIEKAKQVIKPRGIYSLIKINKVEKAKVLLENGEVLQGHDIAKHCRGFSHVFLMAVTIGKEIDRMIEESPVDEAMIIDAFGSEAVEGAAESLNRAIERESVHYGLLRFNWRYSPGYGDFPLETNLVFDKILRMNEIGISVMENLSLSPRKSITAIIPAGR